MNLRKVRILDSTFITPIQMEGPVVTPLPLTTPVIFDLVRRGYQVVENIDGQDIRLTLVNVKDPRKYLNNNVTNVTINPIPFSNVSNFLIPIIYWCIAPIAIPKKQNGILYILTIFKIYLV